MYKELQLYMGSPTVKIVARERRQESIWSNTTMSEQAQDKSAFAEWAEGRSRFQVVERNMQGHGVLLELEQSSSREGEK